MTPIALTFLILSILIVWGGLAASIIALVRTSDEPDAPRAEASEPTDL